MMAILNFSSSFNQQLQIDPDSLLPQLPKPAELRPFPTTLAIEYRGHKGSVSCVSVAPGGQWYAMDVS